MKKLARLALILLLKKANRDMAPKKQKPSKQQVKAPSKPLPVPAQKPTPPPPTKDVQMLTETGSLTVQGKGAEDVQLPFSTSNFGLTFKVVGPLSTPSCAPLPDFVTSGKLKNGENGVPGTVLGLTWDVPTTVEIQWSVQG